MSLENSYSLDDEYEDDVSDSGSSVTYYFCDFSLRFDNYVGSVNVLGSGVFTPTGVESKGG